MTGDILPHTAHVLRYVGPNSILEDGSIEIHIKLRTDKNEKGWSVHCLEYFGGRTKADQVDQVRQVARITLKKTGLLVEWEVGAVLQHLRDKAPQAQFVNKPLAADQNHRADPSHSELEGLPFDDEEQIALISDMIAERITSRYQAAV